LDHIKIKQNLKKCYIYKLYNTMKRFLKLIYSLKKEQKINILSIFVMAVFAVAIGASIYNAFINLEENSLITNKSVLEISQPDFYNKQLKIKLLGHEFSMAPLGALEAKAQTISDNVIKYIDAFPNTDIVQTKSNNKLKEDIILKQPGHPEEFTYQIDLTSYDFIKTEQGDFTFYIRGKKGDDLYRVFNIPAPFLIDANNKKSSTSEVETNLTNNGRLTIKPNQKWLSQAKYPVILDPTIEIVILNVHSHPAQGENWEVGFTTQGTADLKIIPNDQATIDDDEFVSLSCDGEKMYQQILAGDVIFYPGWSCSGEGRVIHYTKKAGNHTLRFEFGGQVAYAYNATTPTGGTITTDGLYTVHTFNSSGTFTVPTGLSGNAAVLVVAGGGAGAFSGGGGAGGLVYQSSHAVTSQTYNITVGDGGIIQAWDQPGGSGQNSIFDNIMAIGGGGGGKIDTAGVSGGSGGGAGGNSAVGGLILGGSGTSGQGYVGGHNDSYSCSPAGGGGGAGEAGHEASPGIGGNGGDGLAYSISGSSVYYAGGGGGGSSCANGGSGGLGGGGNASSNGLANRGGGGGGRRISSVSPGAGGSGIVIIRYLTSDFTPRDNVIFRTKSTGGPTGGTITTDGLYTVHKFTSSGTITFPRSVNVAVLVVGGGGAGGSWVGGGGGGGGIIYEASHAVTAQSYSVVIGIGGQPVSNADGANGGNSVFDTITAHGGGGGGANTNKGVDGGSGGGSGNVMTIDYGDGISGEGNHGGVGDNSTSGGGGGGKGENGNTDGQGYGGDGAAYTISGISTYYGGGGGGWVNGLDANIKPGGDGGGGAGGSNSLLGGTLRGADGAANTGGGGGGGVYTGFGFPGGAGGSGVVIIRYLTSDFASGSNILFRTKSTGSPTGGTITTDGLYTVHKFTSGGTITFPRSGNVAVLVVGGGGGGGSNLGGGGGAGGFVYNSSFAVTAQAYTVTVGSGGTAGSGNNIPGGNGGNSVFSTITATGGGGGGSLGSSSSSSNGKNGGSGGGGASSYNPMSWPAGSGGSGSQGSAGGSGTTNDTFGAGGGGAGGIGMNGISGGNGGSGTVSTISGSSVTYAGGGAGAGFTTCGSASGGGGSGTAGAANTGGGGSGGKNSEYPNGYAGGSGIVIIRYLTSDFNFSVIFYR